MKLHLPVRLFRAVMALMLAAPAALYAAYTAPTTITTPSGYTQVTVDALADITAYSSTAQDVAFLLDASSLPDGMLTISDLSSSLMTSSADSWYFTSYSPSSLASLTFCEATTRLFYVASGESLQFTALQHLLFEGNTYSTSSADGGAIFGYSSSTITLSDNGSVSFSGNTARNRDNFADGGAIYGDSSSSITLSGNESVSFSGNTASGYYDASGGAIYGGSSSPITLSGNGSVEFSENTASTTASDSYAYGGAIYGDDSSTITLSDNGSVSFSENTARSRYSDAFGGAIRAYGHLSIQNNDSVLFEKNVEKSGSSYRLRSIYAGGSGDVISLSAAEGKSIEFRDSVYIASGSTFDLNADYTDDEGVEHKQAGDIIFTGAYTEADLLAVKGSKGTATEILNSRTSEVCTQTKLYGGRLRVEEGAIYKGNGITAMEGSNATVRVKNATLDHAGYDLIFHAGTSLSLSGNSFVFAAQTKMMDGSAWVLDYTDAQGLIEISGKLTLQGSVTLNFEGSDALAENTTLLYVAGAVEGWTADAVTIQGVSYHPSQITWVGNLLVLDYNEATFNQYFNGSCSYETRLTVTPLLFHHYETLSFENILHESSPYAEGGAIYGEYNREYNSTITLSDNESVSFSGNTVSTTGSDYYAYGGAIYGYYITLSGNESVTYSGNTASSIYSSAEGGAIYGDSITLSGNESVSFSGNTASATSISPYYARGGAIYGDIITLSGNGSVSFSGNTASGRYAYGGAIVGSSYSTITLSDNESVSFSENTASSRDHARGGAIYGDSTITLSGNGSVSFSGNTASSYYYACGGAIYGGSSSTITLSGNESVEFSGNTASGSNYADGGAIYGDSITLSGNGSVSFSGNTASASTTGSDSYASGGAIDGETITLSGNGSVSFSGNTASGRYASGGAIYGINSSTITLSGNESVEFSGNTASSSDRSAYGGAIDGDSITLSGNGSVSFSENTASSSSSYAYGGAIDGYRYSTITLSDNGSVSFSRNTASSSSTSAYGGAIYGINSSTITLSGNGSVSFSGNTASASTTGSDSDAYGGAIYVYDSSTITLSGNESVSFSENTASSSSSDAYGGAIYGHRYSTITLSGNESVSFSGNTASSSYDSAYGGAIYGEDSSTITLSGNESVSFSGNTASGSSGAYGGAIYAAGNVSIQNNDSVLFEKNVEKSGSAYRLRSICAGGRGGVISLSAAAGKSIEFRDSVYIASDSTFHLNADYADAAGAVHKQTGDIIFTGAYTEADMLAVKGSVGTASEITLSRTSEVLAMTSLFGGCLRVEDGAIYKGNGITAMEGSNATVRVKNATLNHDGYQLSFAEGTSLQAAGVSTITASSLNMADGSTLSFGISAENKDEAVLTLAGAFNLAGHLSVNLLFSEDLLVTNEYKLFTVNNTPTWWTPENVSIQGDSNWNIDYDDLRWVDGTLVLKMELTDWTNENGNGIWSSSDSSGPQDGDIVLFDDAGSGVVQLDGELKPGFVLVNNGDAHDYTWTGDGYLSGEMSLQKRGEGSLTIETQNQYSGGTVLEAGRLVAGHEMAFGSGVICVKGGELDANHVAIANDILATGGTLSGLDNYAGSLTVDGDVSLSEGITTAQQLIHKSGTLSGGSVSGSNLLILGGTQDFTLVGENTLMDGSVLSQALHNEGVLTVDGQIDVSQLELHYEAAGRVNAQGDEIAMSESGFGKAFYYGVQLTDGAGTVVDGGASITHEETDYTLTLRSNGVASYGGDVDYSHFFLEGNDCYGVSALEAQTGVNLRMVSMSSGTLDVDDDVKVQATGGSIHIVRDAKLCGLVDNVALTVSAAADVRADIKGTSSLALENAQVRLSGENSFNGGIFSQGESQLSVESADPLMLAQSISNTGTLSLSGAFELSQLAKDSLLTWVNAAGIVGESGFSTYGGYTVQMVQGGNVKDAGVILTSGLDTLKLGEDGVATRKADVDYSHYAVATGDVVSISEINRVATGNGCALTSISTTGGRLALDEDVSGSLTLDSGNLIIGKNTVVVSDTLTLGTELQVTLTDTYTGGLVYTLIEAESIEGKCEGWEISSSPRQTYTLYIENNALKMLVEGDVAWLTWANDKKAVWREAAGGWQNGESFYQGDHATIGDGTVTIEGVVNPSSILLNPTKSLTFKTKFDKKTGLWSGAIDGEDITLTIAAGPKGKVTMNDGNTYTGETIIESGTVSVGGVDSFGESDITLSGGTLDLKSKAVDNAITLTDSAAIKGGAKYVGEFTLSGGELQKGSVLNVADTAILESGILNGTLSGVGNVNITGAVTLGDAGKLNTSAVTVSTSGNLEIGTKGLALGGKNAVLSVDGELTSEGKLSTHALVMNGGTLTIAGAKAANLDIKGKGITNILTDATVNVSGAMNVTGNLEVTDGSHITLADANTEKPKAMGLTVKGNLTLDGGSSITLSGALSAKDLVFNGGVITMTGSKQATIKVSNALTLLEGGVDLNFDAGIVDGKSYKIITFKTIGDGDTLWDTTATADSVELYDLLGLSSDACTLTLDVKKKCITMMVIDADGLKTSASQTMAVSEDDEEDETVPVDSALAAPAALVQQDYSPLADALVQANWGMVETSRAFVNTIANRSMAVQLGDGERAVWASAIGGSSRRSSNAGHYGADTSITGGAVGMESQLGESSLLGVALGNSWTRVSAHGFGKIKQDTTHFGLYGQTNWGVLSADWSAAYGRSESRSNGSSWNQQSIQLDARLSYNHALTDNTLLRGFAGAQYYGHDSATVDGIETGKVQNLRAEVGVGIVHYTEKSSVYAEVALLQDVARHNPEVRTPDGQRYRGINPGRTGVNITVGGSYALSEQWSLNASYTAEIVENATSHSINAGATYKF